MWLVEGIRRGLSSEAMAAYMLTKSLGPAILAVDMKLLGINVKSG